MLTTMPAARQALEHAEGLVQPAQMVGGGKPDCIPGVLRQRFRGECSPGRGHFGGRGASRPSEPPQRDKAVDGKSGVSARRGVKALAMSNRPKAASQKTRAMRTNIRRDRAHYGCGWPFSPPSSRHIFRRYDGETWIRSCFEK